MNKVHFMSKKGTWIIRNWKREQGWSCGVGESQREERERKEIVGEGVCYTLERYYHYYHAMLKLFEKLLKDNNTVNTQDDNNNNNNNTLSPLCECDLSSHLAWVCF